MNRVQSRASRYAPGFRNSAPMSSPGSRAPGRSARPARPGRTARSKAAAVALDPALHRREELRDRLEGLRRFDAEDPDGRWFLPLAGCLRELGELREALRTLRHGLARDPECLGGWVLLGECHLESGELGRRAPSAVARLVPRSRERACLARIGGGERRGSTSGRKPSRAIARSCASCRAMWRRRKHSPSCSTTRRFQEKRRLARPRSRSRPKPFPNPRRPPGEASAAPESSSRCRGKGIGARAPEARGRSAKNPGRKAKRASAERLSRLPVERSARTPADRRVSSTKSPSSSGYRRWLERILGSAPAAEPGGGARRESPSELPPASDRDRGPEAGAE